MVNLVWALGVDQGMHEPAHQYAAHAAALLAGLGGDAALEADLASHEATVLRDEGRATEAEKLARDTVQKRVIAFGTAHPRYAMALNNLAAIVSDEGRFAEALELARSALAINARTLGEHHPDYALSLQSVGGALNLVGRRAEARSLVTRAMTVFEEALGPGHARVASAEFTLGLIDDNLGELAEAERHLRHAAAVAESLRGDGHVYVAQYTDALADVLVKEGRYDDAEVLYRRDLEFLAKDNNLEEAAAAQTGLGKALVSLGRPREARVVLDAALRWREANDHNARDLAQTRLALSRAMVAGGGDRTRARILATQALETFAADPGTEGDLREAKEWLEHLDRQRSPSGNL